MKKLSYTLLAAVAALGIAVTGTMAQAPKSEPLKPVSAGALASAKEILAAKNVSAIYQGAIPGLAQRVKDTMIQSNLNLQKDLDEAAAKVVKDMTGREQEIGEQMAKIYANAFTEQELKDIATFYKSPLGKKVIDAEPTAFNQSRIYMGEWAQKITEEINTKVRAEMKARGKPVSG